jgi:hypothetical protein
MENQTEPVVTPQVVMEPKGNNFLVILLSTLLFISVVIAGFFAFQTQKLVKELSLRDDRSNVDTSTIEITPPTISPIATSNPAIDSVANWKTYTNKEIGFLIQYPTGWRMAELESGVMFGPSEIGEDLLIGINYYEKSASSLSSIINEIGKQFSDRKVVEDTILIKPENIQAEKIIVTTATIPDWYSVTVLYTTPTHYITVSNGAIKDKNLPFSRGVPADFTFEKFYSTFKFIN